MEMDFPEFLHILGLLLTMQVYEIHGPHRMYWTEGDDIFPSFEFGKIMSYHRFDDILRFLQLSFDEDPEQQTLL